MNIIQYGAKEDGCDIYVHIAIALAYEQTWFSLDVSYCVSDICDRKDSQWYYKSSFHKHA